MVCDNQLIFFIIPPFIVCVCAFPRARTMLMRIPLINFYIDYGRNSCDI